MYFSSILLPFTTPLFYASGLLLLGAFEIDMLVIPFASCIATISHRKNMGWSVASYVVIGGILGSGFLNQKGSLNSRE